MNVERVHARFDDGISPQPLRAAALRAAAEDVVEGGTVDEVDEEMSIMEMRKMELRKVPTLSAITGAGPVEEEVYLYLTPLRGAAAAAAVVDETTHGAAVHTKEDVLYKALLEMPNHEVGLAITVDEMLTEGRASLAACRSGMLQHRRNGIYWLRAVLQHPAATCS